MVKIALKEKLSSRKRENPENCRFTVSGTENTRSAGGNWLHIFLFRMEMAVPEILAEQPLFAGQFDDVFHLLFQHGTGLGAFQERGPFRHHEGERFGPVLDVVAHGITRNEITVKSSSFKIVLPFLPAEFRCLHFVEAAAGVDEILIVETHPFPVQVDLGIRVEGVEQFMVDRWYTEIRIQIDRIARSNSAGRNFSKDQIVQKCNIADARLFEKGRGEDFQSFKKLFRQRRDLRFGGKIAPDSESLLTVFYH